MTLVCNRFACGGLASGKVKEESTEGRVGKYEEGHENKGQNNNSSQASGERLVNGRVFIRGFLGLGGKLGGRASRGSGTTRASRRLILKTKRKRRRRRMGRERLSLMGQIAQTEEHVLRLSSV